ncbi:MAG: prephenate dehydrogenase/arogenate dehydrogenase family protein, partial [Bryobacteraceae bacterium]
MDTVAIVGVGLIGASFGLALKEAGFRGTILGVSSEASMRAGLDRGAIDRGATLEQAARSADLLYLAQPIGRILDTLHHLDPLVRPEALVTDAGST